MPAQGTLVSPYMTHFIALPFCILLLTGLHGMSMLWLTIMLLLLSK